MNVSNLREIVEQLIPIAQEMMEDYGMCGEHFLADECEKDIQMFVKAKEHLLELPNVSVYPLFIKGFLERNCQILDFDTFTRYVGYLRNRKDHALSELQAEVNDLTNFQKSLRANK